MGLFSAAPPLRDEMRGAITPFLYTDAPDKDQKRCIDKIASMQDAIISTLNGGEELIVIVPCVANNTGWDGAVVATSERILHVKGGKIRKQMPRGDLADVKRLVSPNGHFIVQLISRSAAPYESFAGGDVRQKSTQLFHEGTIQVPIQGQNMMDDLLTKVGYED